MLRELSSVRNRQSAEADVARAVARYDAKLRVWWGLALPADVRGGRSRWRFKERWVLYRQGKPMAVPIESGNGMRISALLPTWHPVTILEEPDGRFRPLDERLLYWLWRCDQFRLHETSDPKRLADRSGAEADAERRRQLAAKEQRGMQLLEDFTLEHHREVADAIDQAMCRQGISL